MANETDRFECSKRTLDVEVVTAPRRGDDGEDEGMTPPPASGHAPASREPSPAREWLEMARSLASRYDQTATQLEQRLTEQVDGWTEQLRGWLLRKRGAWRAWESRARADLTDLGERLRLARGSARTRLGDQRSRLGSASTRERARVAWRATRPPAAPEERPAPATESWTADPAPPPAAAARSREGAVLPPEAPDAPEMIPLREQALAAWQAARDQRAAIRAARQRELDAREARALQVLARDRLGVTATPRSGHAQVEGIDLAVRWNERAGGYELVVIEPCRDCGKPTPSQDIRGLADLGAVLDRDTGAPHLCLECQAVSAPSPEPDTAERLVAVMREFIVEELSRDGGRASRARNDGDERPHRSNVTRPRRR